MPPEEQTQLVDIIVQRTELEDFSLPEVIRSIKVIEFQHAAFAAQVITVGIPDNTPPPASDRREHGWYYYPEMTMDEVILLKQWDSRGAVACGAHSDGEEEKNGDETKTSTFTIHSAFIDPTYGKDAPPRKSIEVRCVVIWEEP